MIDRALVMRRLSFAFEGRDYVIADEAIEGFEPVDDIEARRILGEALRRGRQHAPSARVGELLADRSTWGAEARARLGGHPSLAENGLDRVPFALWRRPEVRAVLDPTVGEAPLLSDLAAPLTAEDGWIEVLVVDELDDPIADQQYELRLSDGRVRRARTNEHGILRYDGLPDGQCELSLPLDAGAWEAA
jgi:hypothetical protein